MDLYSVHVCEFGLPDGLRNVRVTALKDASTRGAPTTFRCTAGRGAPCRTGRIGKKGTAISLVGGADLNTRRVLERDHKVEFERRELPDAETAIRARVDRQARTIKSAMGTMVFESYIPTVKALLERDDGQALLAASLRAFFQWDRRRRALAAGIDLDREEAERREHANRKAERKRGKGRGRSDRGPKSRGERPSKTKDLDQMLSEAPSEGAGKKKRRRRRRKSGGGGAETSSAPASTNLDALLSEG